MESYPQVNISSSEKQFIEFLVDFIVTTNPGDLITNQSNITDHLQKNYEKKHELNLHRKQYGNIKDCIKQDGIKMVFKLDGLAFKFLHHTKVEQAYQAGVLTEAGWARFQEGRRSFLTKHLKLCKNNGMNICRNCETKYFLGANNDEACIKGGAHVAQYDFDISDNVLECEITE